MARRTRCSAGPRSWWIGRTSSLGLAQRTLRRRSPLGSPSPAWRFGRWSWTAPSVRSPCPCPRNRRRGPWSRHRRTLYRTLSSTHCSTERSSSTWPLAASFAACSSAATRNPWSSRCPTARCRHSDVRAWPRSGSTPASRFRHHHLRLRPSCRCRRRPHHHPALALTSCRRLNRRAPLQRLPPPSHRFSHRRRHPPLFRNRRRPPSERHPPRPLPMVIHEAMCRRCFTASAAVGWRSAYWAW